MRFFTKTAVRYAGELDATSSDKRRRRVEYHCTTRSFMKRRSAKAERSFARALVAMPIDDSDADWTESLYADDPATGSRIVTIDWSRGHVTVPHTCVVNGYVEDDDYDDDPFISGLDSYDYDDPEDYCALWYDEDSPRDANDHDTIDLEDWLDGRLPSLDADSDPFDSDPHESPEGGLGGGPAEFFVGFNRYCYGS